MSWAEHAVLWHVYPLGMTGAPIRDRPDDDAAPRLERLIDRLDHAEELGVTGLLLGPVFAASTHGYDSTDQLAIDPRLGDLSTFDSLVAACRERGLRLVLDGVFNHLGSQHPLVQRALTEGPDGELASFVRVDWAAPGGPAVGDFEGHGDLVALDHDEPAVAAYVADVMRFWLARGADGWRLDAAYAVPPSFWARVLPTVRAEHPDAWFVGEVIHGDYAAIAREGDLDSVTQYELWKAIWSSLTDRNFFELDWCLTRHAALLDDLLPQTFVGNHDVTRIATRVGEGAAVLALVVLMTTGGVPSVYYGDELGLEGLKEERLGGDDAVRPVLPDRPEDLPAHAGATFRRHQELIRLRRQRPWLSRARTETLELTNTRYVYAARSRTGDERLVVELDVTDVPTAQLRDGDGTVLFSSH